MEAAMRLVNRAFGHRLRQLRERRGISRLVLGELCGLSKNMISRYERGERSPSVETVVQLADYFGVTTDWLLGRE